MATSVERLPNQNPGLRNRYTLQMTHPTWSLCCWTTQGSPNSVATGQKSILHTLTSWRLTVFSSRTST